MKPRFHHLLLVRCDWEIHRHLCGIALKIYNIRNQSLRFVRTCEHFRKQSWALMIAYLICDNLAEKSAWNLWKFTRNFWNREAPCFANFLVNTLNSLQMAGWPLRSLSWAFIRPSLNILYIVLQFLHSLHFGRIPRIFRDGFPQNSCSSVKKADNSGNFAASGIIKRTHIITHLVETRTNTRWAVMWWFTRQRVM
jgi:hypothetical protein